MGLIKGDEKVLQRVEKSKSADGNVYFNIDAIKLLPDEFDAIVSEVRFSKDDFYDLKSGETRYMPKPELTYRIAEARGVYGLIGRNEDTYPVYETVDISEMNMSNTVQMINMLVGYGSMKRSAVLTEDGRENPSSPCTVEWNAWVRCTEEWAKEELATAGYTQVKTGEYTYYNNKCNGPHYIKQNGQYANAYPVKYGTKFQRKAHFKSELKFALAKSQSKAEFKSIRELACLKTGYSKADVDKGVFYFAKIVRSSEILKLETAARLYALKNGATPEKSLLFADEDAQETIIEAEDVSEHHIDAEDVHEAPPTATNEEKQPIKAEQAAEFLASGPIELKAVLSKYMKDDEIVRSIPNTNFNRATKLIDILTAHPELDTENPEKWKEAVDFFKAVEKDIPEMFRERHKIY